MFLIDLKVCDTVFAIIPSTEVVLIFAHKFTWTEECDEGRVGLVSRVHSPFITDYVSQMYSKPSAWVQKP
jgi:hypothetical protein